MTKPPSSVRSIRLPDEMWAWLVAEAERRETSVNGLVTDFLIVGRLKAAERATAELPNLIPSKPIKRRSSPAKAVERAPKLSVSVPYAGDLQRKAYQKGAKK